MRGPEGGPAPGSRGEPPALATIVGSAEIRNIRRCAEVPGPGAHHDRVVEIHLTLDAVQPPQGRLLLSPAGGPPGQGPLVEIRFDGWLGLLVALHEVIAEQRYPHGPSS